MFSSIGRFTRSCGRRASRLQNCVISPRRSPGPTRQILASVSPLSPSSVPSLPPSHSQAYGNGFGSSLSKGEKVSSQMQRRRDVPTPTRPDHAPHSSREHFVEQELSADSASSSVSLSLTVRTISRKISSIRSWLGSSSFQRPTGIISRIRQRYRAWCPGALASRGAGATLGVELQVCLDFHCVVLFFFFSFHYIVSETLN